MAIIRPNKDLLRPRFLSYFLASPFMQARMLSLAVGKGTSRNALTKRMIEQFEIPCPPIDIQDNITGYLSSYDALIENNLKRIKLLEEAAQRLYKEWFIDLRFPGYENVKITDGVPEGWRIYTINELCIRINAGGTPSRSRFSYWNNPSVQWYKTQELLDCWLIDSDEKISLEGLENSSAKLFPKNTILMAIYASPTLGRMGILKSESACNQAALGLVANESLISWQWLYYKLLELRNEFKAIASGAGQQNINTDIVKKTAVIVPANDLITQFTNIVAPFFMERLNLQEKNMKLQEARDCLLPKLMNGEIEL